METIIQPSIFFGHGNPMNALSTNGYTKAWQRIGRDIPRPKAILSISAHWYVAGSRVTVSTSPKTIHDFGGFPPELYRVQYPAPGDPILARHVQKLLAPQEVAFDGEWGLDHGTWSVLRHVYPHADIPVIQLSIDATLDADVHFEIGKKLAPLRDEGILILGSGNLVHNLHTYKWEINNMEPYDWAMRFENSVKEKLIVSDYNSLIVYDAFGQDARLSVPTPEHYLPLLYVIATQQKGERIRFPVEGIEGGSISMLSVQVG